MGVGIVIPVEGVLHAGPYVVGGLRGREESREYRDRLENDLLKVRQGRDGVGRGRGVNEDPSVWQRAKRKEACVVAKRVVLAVQVNINTGRCCVAHIT